MKNILKTSEDVVKYLKENPGMIIEGYCEEDKAGIDETVLYNPSDWYKDYADYPFDFVPPVPGMTPMVIEYDEITRSFLPVRPASKEELDDAEYEWTNFSEEITFADGIAISEQEWGVDWREA